MIRAANTGVSAVIDAYGRVLASLDMQQEGIIDHRLPPPRAATPYARWGDWTLLRFWLISRRVLLLGAPTEGLPNLIFNVLGMPEVQLALSERR